MARPMRWLVVVAAAVAAFGVSLWVATSAPLGWMPGGGDGQLAVATALASVVAAAVAAAVGWWAGDRRPVTSPDGDRRRSPTGMSPGSEEGQMGYSHISSASRNSLQVHGHGNETNIGNQTHVRHQKPHSATAMITLVVLAIAGILVLAWLTAKVTSQEGPPPSAEMSISPASGTWGSKAQITGQDFRPLEVVTVYAQTPQSPHLGQFRTDADGSFTGSVRIPEPGLLSQVQNQLAIAAAIGDGKEPDTGAFTYFTIQN